ILDTGHGDGAFRYIQAAAKAVEDRVGLFEDLLDHEMIVAAFFDGCQLQVQLLDVGGQLFVAQVLEDELVGFQDGQLVVIDVYDLFGVFDDGGGVGGKEMFSFPDTDDQGAAFPGGDDRVGLIFIQQDDDIGAYDPFEGDANGFFQAAIVVLLYVFDEIEEDF